MVIINMVNGAVIASWQMKAIANAGSFESKVHINRMNPKTS